VTPEQEQQWNYLAGKVWGELEQPVAREWLAFLGIYDGDGRVDRPLFEMPFVAGIDREQVRRAFEVALMMLANGVIPEGMQPTPVSTSEKRLAPVQGDHHIAKGQPGREPGTITWAEHLDAYAPYAKRYGRDQSAERIAERGGFGYRELTDQLGHPPKTWRPIKRESGT